jgi:hypothetical protein
METTRNNLRQHSDSAFEALKRAYQECPNTTTGSLIISALNSLIHLENEIKKSRHQQSFGGRHEVYNPVEYLSAV